MKKIQYILMGLAALATAASCTLNQLEEPVPQSRGGETTEVVFTAIAPGGNTKTTVAESGPDILWENNDAIMVLSGEERSRFTTELDAPSSLAEFRGYIYGFSGSTEGSTGASHAVWAVYPYNDFKTSRSGESVTVFVPGNQKARAGSYDPSALVAVASSNNLQLGFYNVCGGLKFKLSKSGIQQVEFRAGGDKPLAGSALVEMDRDGFPVVSVAAEKNDAKSAVRLTAPYGEEFKPDTWYYLTCMPGALDQGYTLFFRSETETGVLEHPTPVEVKRSVWGVLEYPEANATFHAEENIIWNEIRYTTTDGNAITPNNVSGFNEEGNSIISNTYEDGLGRIIFENLVTRIPNSAFAYFGTLETVRLPGTVEAIQSSAIRNNNALKEVRLADGVKSIDSYAFASNPLLERVTVPATVSELGRMVFSSSPSLSSFGDVLTSEDERCLIIRDTLVAFAPKGVTEYTIPSGVKGIGWDAFAYGNELQSLVIPEGVGEIDMQAFYYCQNLATVTLPASLKKIESYAFSWSGLTSITVPEGVEIADYAFTYCKSMTSATLPTTEIGEAPLCGNDALEALNGPLASADHRLLVKDGKIIAVAPAGLTELTIPGEIKEIGPDVFAGLTGLKKVILEDGVETIGDEAFYNCSKLEEVSVPASVTSLGINAFYGCNNLATFSGGLASADGRCLVLNGLLYHFAPAGLTEYTVPAGVTSIGYRAFYNSQNLTAVTIPGTVQTIGEYAFGWCSNLVSVSLEEGLQQIGDYAFYYCTGLSSVILPEGLQEIGLYAFYRCTSLTSFEIPSTVKQIGDQTFYYCTGLQSITLHDGLQQIGNYAFYYCNNLRTLEIPSTVTWIGNRAFYNCTSLYSLTLHEGLQEIGENAFYNSGLNSLTIPASVTSIGRYSFYSNYLRKVTMLPVTPLQNSNWVFNPDVIETIAVPQESLSAYLSVAPWYWYDASKFIAIVDQNNSTTEGVGEQDWN